MQTSNHLHSAHGLPRCLRRPGFFLPAALMLFAALSDVSALPWPVEPVVLTPGQSASGVTNTEIWFRLDPAGNFHHGLHLAFTGDTPALTVYDESVTPLTNGCFTHWGWTPQDSEPRYLSIVPGAELQYSVRFYNLTSTIARVSALTTNLMAEFNLVGCGIALVDGAYPVWQTGFGQADRARGIPATADTVFMIGSCSKTFGGLAVMQLVEQSRLDLDAPLADALPAFSIHQRFAGNRITPRTIMTHHSGLPGDIFNGMFTVREKLAFTNWLENYLAADYTLAPTNYCWAYNNSGFVMLGNAIEHLAGTNLSAHIRNNIFLPMGMTNTSLLRDLPNIALPYVDGEEYPEEQCMGFLAGSILSTAADMSRYLRTLLGGGQGAHGRVVLPATLAAMTVKQNDGIALDAFSTALNMGLVFVMDPPNLQYMGKILWHDGGTVYFRSLFRVALDAGLGAFISCNSAEGAAANSAIIDSALRWAYEEKTGIAPPVPGAPATHPAAAPPDGLLDMAAGVYITSSGFDRFDVDASGLRWTRNAHLDTPAVTDLVYRADGWFTPPDAIAPQLLFTQTVERVVCAIKSFNGGFTNTALYGDRSAGFTNHAAWNNRLGRWWAVDIHPDDITWLVPASVGHLMLDLTARDSMLLLSPSVSTEAGLQVIDAAGADLGFVAGLGRNKGNAVSVSRAGTVETLRWMGAHYRRESELTLLANGAAATGTIAGDAVAWYRAPLAAATAAAIELTSAAGVVAYVYTTESIPLGQAVNGQPCQAPAADADRVLMIAVLRNGGVPGAYRLTVQTPALTCPAAGDFDGDGLADPAMADAAGNWHVWFSGNAYQHQGPFPLGVPGLPAAGDFDGDGRADPAMTDAAGNWHVWLSGNAYQRQGPFPLGVPGLPAAGDFDGDGLADIVMADAAGNGHAWLSGNNYQQNAPFPLDMIGHPTAGDFDGDGRADLAIPDGAGGWYAWLSRLQYARSGPHRMLP